MSTTTKTMEELADAFSGAFNVTLTPNSTATAHPRISQHKQKVGRSNQEERRRLRLENQKQKRRDFANHARCLAGEGTEEASEHLEDDVQEEMEVSRTRRTRSKKKTNYYKDQLMMSEWLVEVPLDLSMEWVMVLCPAGKRTLVIASKGKTVVYNKAGYFLNTFPSLLPGGSYKDRRRSINEKYTILDCIYSEITRTFFVLDVMCWNGHPIYDSETEFRFYWMHTKFSEEPRLAEKSKINPFLFKPLPNCSCDSASIADIMSKPLPFQMGLDGLLFYHKRTHYTLGSTPLVGWLKPWMLPDMLGIPVPDSIMACKPPDAKMRPPSPNAMDTEAKGKTQGGDGRRQSGGSGKKSGQGKGDRKSGRQGMDTEDTPILTTSPVYKFGGSDMEGSDALSPAKSPVNKCDVSEHSAMKLDGNDSSVMKPDGMDGVG